MTSNEEPTSETARREAMVRAVVMTGLLAATLDITAAIVNFLIATGGANPLIVLQYIASGVLGPAAFQNGAWAAAAGLLFHCVIAVSWTALFFAAYFRLEPLRRVWIVSGVLYGLFVWTAMTKIVVPLSNVRPVQHTLLRDLLAIAILMACVGIPVAWSAKRHYARQEGTPALPPAR